MRINNSNKSLSSLGLGWSVDFDYFPINFLYQIFIAEFFFLVINHRELISLQFIFLQFQGLSHQISQLYDFSIFTAGFQCLPADFIQLVDGLVVNLDK